MDMNIQKSVIEFWPRLRELVFGALPDGTSTYYFSKTRVVELDIAARTLFVVCTNAYVYEQLIREKEAMEKAYFDAFRFTIHIELLNEPVQVDPRIYIERIEREEEEERRREEKERKEADDAMRREHPEYFRDSESSAHTESASAMSASTQSDDEYRRYAPKDLVPPLDFIEIEAKGKRVRLGSTLSAYNPAYTFDTYVEGSSNKFAKAACLAVANKPASGYNPLFIYGPSGLGKTHLLYAITNRVRELYPEKKIMYITCEQFTNQLIQCLSLNAMHEFRNLYRTRDVLLIDDIQFIEGKPATQEEVFHTINAMIESGCQMIFTSDRTPNDMKDLENRLRTRFEWGLIADIQPPDLELRTAIFKSKAEENALKISDDVILFLAENLRSNVRQIEGAIKRFSARSFLMGMTNEIDMEYAKSCLPDLLGEDEPIDVSIDKIFACVYEKYNITREALVSSSRTKDIAYARKIAIYLIKKKLGLSVTSIARLFNRDHATVIASINDAAAKEMTDARVMGDLNDFYGKLKITR